MKKICSKFLSRDVYAVAALTMATLCPALLSAQSANATPNTTASAGETAASSLKWSDQHFVNKVSEDNQKEVAFARLATQRAANPEVKSFAQQMVTDHTALDQDLTQLAQQKGVALKDQMNMSGASAGTSTPTPSLGWISDHEYTKLSRTNGQDFDREFVDMMVDDHESAVKLFEKKSQSADDPDVKEFAAKHLPTLREHLAKAQSLKQSMK